MFKSTVKPASFLSSLKLSFAGMATLLAGVLVFYLNQNQSVLWIAIPLLVLAINLLSAIVYNPRIRQNSGLLMFHICLLALALLVAFTQLTSMKGRVEIVQGQTFDSQLVTIVQQGPWHDIEQLNNIRFQQGGFQVEYSPDLRRGKTTSRLLKSNAEVVVGDTTGFTEAGYHFYTTSNKGYAAMLVWYGQSGEVIHGAVHFPSFPLYDWKQENQWITPAGQLIKMKLLNVHQADVNNHWQLDSRLADGSLHIETADDTQKVLAKGQRIQLSAGQLEFTEVRMWMGYSIFYNPWLAWLFATAIVGVLGLGWHYYLKLGRAEPGMESRHLNSAKHQAQETLSITDRGRRVVPPA